MCAVDIYISVGSNIAGESERRVEDALRFLSDSFGEASASEVYRTAPLSGIGEMYANAVFRARTDLPAEDVTVMLKQYERDCGRIKGDKQHVVIDLDLVVYGAEVLRPKDAVADFFLRGYNQLLNRL